MSNMLEVTNLDVSYGAVAALRSVNIAVPKGSVVVILGSNGAGKSTFLNTISGIVRPKGGSIRFEGVDLPNAQHKIVQSGVVQVPEGRRIFGGLSVQENLSLGGYLTKSSTQIKRDMDRICDLFPILQERRHQQAGTLSGGEQQMLAIGRGLMANPKMLLLDEPSLGLSPNMVKEVFKIIRQIREMGITVLLVEQNACKALAICDYAYVLENGRITIEGSGNELACNEDIKRAYLAC